MCTADCANDHTFLTAPSFHHPTKQPPCRVTPGAAGGAAVDPGLEVRVAAAGNANVLVAMAARESAMHRYGNALYCLRRAVQMDPGNAG